MIKAAMFILGFVCGMAFVMVVSCLIISHKIGEQKELEILRNEIHS